MGMTDHITKVVPYAPIFTANAFLFYKVYIDVTSVYVGGMNRRLHTSNAVPHQGNTIGQDDELALRLLATDGAEYAFLYTLYVFNFPSRENRPDGLVAIYLMTKHEWDDVADGGEDAACSADSVMEVQDGTMLVIKLGTVLRGGGAAGQEAITRDGGQGWGLGQGDPGTATGIEGAGGLGVRDGNRVQGLDLGPADKGPARESRCLMC
ncbi:hypothetical protein BDK51DRAFT_34476 [Blyttiomyces helicus]|uniref:Uncharacterized protein n=1 Tax=Blyttiomyces helicus TaxID=388810 RepID=A0A4V1ISN4_9FUNG|nr:hypothetical protein BDK51DRAFT_34476 [Blyttiomyces helicus]|eukprot:RKO94167.1 hypothetical protein BDK51DRAFT_34476 [Blyttiomyces helicus]